MKKEPLMLRVGLEVESFLSLPRPRSGCGPATTSSQSFSSRTILFFCLTDLSSLSLSLSCW